MSIFTDILSDEMKTTWVDMITEVIRGCAVSCTVYYGVTLYTDCANCIFDPIGNKSSNRYLSGGPMPFTVGNCPMCAGVGKIPDEQTEDITLCPIYDYKNWIPTISSSVKDPKGFVQTISAFSQFDTLRRAKEIVIDTDISSSTIQRFERYGKPEPCGFGASDFIVTMWHSIENG